MMKSPMPRLRPILDPNLSSKIRWRMRFDRNPLFVTLQDKFSVRGYARERGVACAPLLHATEDPGTIPFDSLPADCMMKASHASGWNLARIEGSYYLFGNGSRLAELIGGNPDRQQLAGTPLATEEAISICRRWLASRYSPKEWAYGMITPRIVVEDRLLPRTGPELYDYRLYTFHGEVRAINIGCARYRRDSLNVFLRPDWSVIPLTTSVESLPPTIPPRPATLTEMIDIARRLGKDLDFVRIDLYDTSRGIILGEMTMYPDAGGRDKPSGCPVLDAWLGAQWRMSPATQGAAAAWNFAEWAYDAALTLARRARERVRMIRRAHAR